MGKIPPNRIMSITNRVMHILDNVEYAKGVDIHIQMRPLKEDMITYEVREFIDGGVTK